MMVKYLSGHKRIVRLRVCYKQPTTILFQILLTSPTPKGVGFLGLISVLNVSECLVPASASTAP